MRKLTVGLIAVALLATAAPARAQFADPLGLIASGLVIPFVGNGSISPGSLSFLEVYAPVGDETGFHMFFFDTSCVRQGDSIGLSLTTNDVSFLRVDNLGGKNPVEGLITAADASGSGSSLVPMTSAVHARVLWVGGSGFVRVLEPISLVNPEAVGSSDILWAPFGAGEASAVTWNPLRSAATFFAPLEGGGLGTTIYFVCPTTAATNDVNNVKSGAFPIKGSSGFLTGFPPLVDPSGNSPQTGTTPLFLRVYDTEEKFLRDVTTDCSCLTARPVLTISQVYGSVVEAPGGTYTEVEGNSTKAVPAVCDFTTPANPSSVNQPAETAAPACAIAAGTVSVGAGGTCGNGATTASGICNTFNLFVVKTAAIPGKGPSVFTGYRAIRFPPFDVFGRLSNGNQLSIRGTGEGAITPGVRNRADCTFQGLGGFCNR
jgi:hypothetical protein